MEGQKKDRKRASKTVKREKIYMDLQKRGERDIYKQRYEESERLE